MAFGLRRFSLTYVKIYCASSFTSYKVTDVPLCDRFCRERARGDCEDECYVAI